MKAYDGICEVSRVGVRFQALARVSCVLRREIGGEIVKTAFDVISQRIWRVELSKESNRSVCYE